MDSRQGVLTVNRVWTAYGQHYEGEQRIHDERFQLPDKDTHISYVYCNFILAHVYAYAFEWVLYVVDNMRRCFSTEVTLHIQLAWTSSASGKCR